MSKKTPTPTQLALLALVARERSGREIRTVYEKQAGHKISLGTLYTTFRRMRAEGWVSARNGDSLGEDARLRYFKISGSGIKALNSAKTEYSFALKLANAALRSLGS